LPATCYAPFGLAFATAGSVVSFTWPQTITSRLIMQKARGQAFPCGCSPSTACRQTVSGPVSLPSQGCFSPFPHGTGSLSVIGEYLALGEGPPGFPQGFSCPAVLRNSPQSPAAFAYRAVTCWGPVFQPVRLAAGLLTPLLGAPATPARG
jgi:hypothetical protein